MLFNGGKLAVKEQIDRRFMFLKKNNQGVLSVKFIGIYPKSQVSVYRTIGPLVKLIADQFASNPS